MSGAIRFSFDRSPDYFAALRVEGRHTDVLVGREMKTGRWSQRAIVPSKMYL